MFAVRLLTQAPRVAAYVRHVSVGRFTLWRLSVDCTYRGKPVPPGCNRRDVLFARKGLHYCARPGMHSE